MRRREFLEALAGLSVSPAVFAQTRPLTCGELTPRQTEGPFFKTDTPRRTSLLEKDARSGTLVLTGIVLSPKCLPVAGALLDFWHADGNGEYDNRAYRYRGHQLSDAQGGYRLETILPGEYPGRTPHIHVKVQAPGRRLLTTQLYFPGLASNRRDGLYRPELEMRIALRGASADGRFDFVVDA